MLFVAIVYSPDVGRGFVKDDFGWIRASRFESARDVIGIFEVLSEDRRTVWMVPPPPGGDQHDTQPVPGYFHSAWMLKDGKLVEVDATRWIGARAIVMN